MASVVPGLASRSSESGTRRDLLKCSYLTKAPPGSDGFTFRQWRRRWFMLCDSAIVYPMAPRSVRLEYYENEEAANGMIDPKGIIDLSECTAVRKSDRTVKGHKFVFSVITDHREYYLSADSAADRNAWVEMLHAVTADDFKAREYRDYLRQSKIYNSDPGPAMMSSTATHAGLSSSGSSPPQKDTHTERTERPRPHSVGDMHHVQQSTGRQPNLDTLPMPPKGNSQSTGAAVVTPAAAGKNEVYTVVNPKPPKNRLLHQRQSAPGILIENEPPPVPKKSSDIYEDEEPPLGRAPKLGTVGSNEKTLTIEQNGFEIEALQPRHFGDGCGFEDSGEAMSPAAAAANPYQNLPQSSSMDDLLLMESSSAGKRSSGTYDHVVHQPSVRHRGPTRQKAQDAADHDSDEYCEIPDDPLDLDGYKQVRHASAVPLGTSNRRAYEEVPAFLGQKPPASPNQIKPHLKRVSSLDMKKKLGVNVAASIDIPSPTARSNAPIGNSRDAYDHLAPSPVPSPKLRHHAPPQQSPHKPSKPPKPQKSLSPPRQDQDEYDHLTPPGSPMGPRRASAAPDLPVSYAFSGLGGDPSHGPLLTPHTAAHRRVSSPSILDEGNKRMHMAGARFQPDSHSAKSSPNVPPRKLKPGGDPSNLAPPRMPKSKSTQALGKQMGLDEVLQQQHAHPHHRGHRQSSGDADDRGRKARSQEAIYDMAA
ncbi:uncharacterized protein LOC135809500 isoform X2 [Sycon ciliatum]|uniref:uncharacterized protein LOC135809500 isoform X2 n=1 Tax=Sycon ciliatum TaxID=27933 RepID=UPI0031F5FCCF